MTDTDVRDFWLSSGHVLLDRSEDGGLVVTDAFLKAYLARPELVPPAEACAAERALHAKLLDDPFADVPPGAVAALADADAQDNWRAFLSFRDRLLAAPTLQGAYVRMIGEGVSGVPPLFLNQLVHVLMRAALDGCEDAMVLRAGEIFFRPQKVTVHEGRLLLADAETIEMHEESRQASPLLAMLGGPAVTELDVLQPGETGYHARSDAFDLVLDLGEEGRAAVARCIEAFLRGTLGLAAEVEAVPRIEDSDWRWFIGLDAEATAIGNALWRGEDVEEEALSRVLALFSMRLDPAVPVRPEVSGHPVYLIMAMDRSNLLRFKPQNLIASLPLAANQPVH